MMLYLSKNEFSAGSRGILAGGVFVPVSGETPSDGEKGILLSAERSAPPEDGLIFHFTGESSTAETGQKAVQETGTILYAQTVEGIPCVSFQSGGSLNFPSPGLSGEFSVTLSVWIYYPSIQNLNRFSWIAMWGRGTRTTPPTSEPSNNEFGFTNGGLDTGGLNGLRYKLGYYFSSHPIVFAEAGTWYHLVMVVNKITKQLSVYLDGELFESSTYEKMNIEDSEFRINQNIEGKGTPSNACSVAGIRVYNRALSGPELVALQEEFLEKRFFLPLQETASALLPGTAGLLLKTAEEDTVFIPCMETPDEGGAK